MVVPVTPAVVMPPVAVMVAPVAPMMAPVPVMVVAVTPVAGVMAMAEMMVLPLHRLDRRLGSERCRRGRRERGGVGGTAAEQAAGHQRECGEGEAGATR